MDTAHGFYTKQTGSTNNLLNKMARLYELPEGFVVYTDFQESGRGQQGNSWESEREKNLLFSMLLYPEHIPIHEQFIISQIASIGIKHVLDQYIENVTIKWPNDIYWNDKKLAGMLIENSLKGANIKDSIVGIGVNINQEKFEHSPNPISMKQITGETYSREKLQKEMTDSILDIYCNWDAERIRTVYMQMLYRKDAYHFYKAQEETFEAKISAIQPDGRLDLDDRKGNRRSFYFKEVQFVS